MQIDQWGFSHISQIDNWDQSWKKIVTQVQFPDLKICLVLETGLRKNWKIAEMMIGKASVRLFEQKLKFCKWYAIFIMCFKCLINLVLNV